jgi:photosystem II stability/assembly factor-like uncharacterized protein
MKRVSVFRAVVGLGMLAALGVLGCGAGEQGTSTDAVTAQGDAIHKSSGPKVTVQNSGTTQGLIAVSALNSRVVWASGRGGTFAVTGNGGKTWRSGVVPGADTVQFRDVEAVSEKVAYLLSVPTDVIPSRIYKTTDGGKTWKIQFEATLDQFHDCFAFWDPVTGLDFADSLNGHFPGVRTSDGQTWHPYGDHFPTPLPGNSTQGGEAGFASGGTCVATQGSRRAWITTGTPPTVLGGAWTTRVLFTTDRGRTWGATTAPISPTGPNAVGGGFSVAFRDARHGILAGGDLGVAAGVIVPNFARSKDGGRTWTLATTAPIPGAIFTAAYAGHGTGHDGWGRDDDDDDDFGEHGHGNGPSIRVVATAPTATAWSPDEGQTWSVISGLTGLWGVDFGDQQTGWLVGTNGQIVRLDF